jgi:hypothetical protein
MGLRLEVKKRVKLRLSLKKKTNKAKYFCISVYILEYSEACRKQFLFSSKFKLNEKLQESHMELSKRNV